MPAFPADGAYFPASGKDIPKSTKGSKKAASPNVSEICRIVFNRWEKPVDSIDSPEKLREKLRYDKGL